MKNIRSVIIVTSVYPPDIGGPSEQARQIANGLADIGWKVTVIVLGIDRVVESASERNKFQVITLFRRRSKNIIFKVLEIFRILNRFSAILKNVNPNLVYFQTPSSTVSAVFCSFARIACVPTFSKYVADSSVQRMSHRKLKRSLPPIFHWQFLSKRTRLLFENFLERKYQIQERAILRLYDRIWATTPMFADKLQTEYRVPESDTWVHPNFIELKYLKVAAREAEANRWYNVNKIRQLRIVMVSRIAPVKCIEVAIQAIALMPNTFRLTIVGTPTGPEGEFYLQKIKDLVLVLGLDERVDFLGGCRWSELPDFLVNSDIFLLTSEYESFGISLVEAMAAETPIVATSVGGVPWVLRNGERGILVQSHDPKAVSSSIVDLSENPHRALEIVEAARKEVNIFDVAQGVDKLSEQFLKLSERKRVEFSCAF